MSGQVSLRITKALPVVSAVVTASVSNAESMTWRRGSLSGLFWPQKVAVSYTFDFPTSRWSVTASVEGPSSLKSGSLGRRECRMFSTADVRSWAGDSEVPVWLGRYAAEHMPPVPVCPTTAMSVGERWELS